MKSRTSNALLNTVTGLISFILIMVASFVMRKIFAVSLGQEFLGLNSLFANIITMLSLTELGIGTAMVFFLYKPLSENNYEKIKSYMQFYKKAYMLIALVVFCVGFALMFFLQYFAKTSINIGEVKFYFMLYVLNATFSYLLAYKKSIIYADQNSRVISISHTVTKLFFTVAQILLLYFTKSFLYFILAMIICTIIDNAICLCYANKKYAYIREKSVDKLTKIEIKEVFDKIIPLFIQNIAVFVVSSTDNIIISAFIGVAVVGIYSNYVLVVQTLKTLYGQVFAAFTTSFGNLTVSATKERCYYIYDKSVFLAFWISCFFASSFLSLIQPFLGIVFGWNYVFPIYIPILITFSLYITSMNIPSISVQNSLGLHKKDSWVMLLQAALNLIISLSLVKVIGVAGVIIGTIISTLLCPMLSKDYVIHKYFFNKKPIPIYLKQLVYAIATIFITAVTYYLCNVLLRGNMVKLFFIKIGICALAPNLIMTAFFFWTDSFKYFIKMVKRGVGKFIGKLSKGGNND